MKTTTSDEMFNKAFDTKIEKLNEEFEGDDLKFEKETLETTMDLTAFIWLGMVNSFQFVTAWSYMEDKDVAVLSKAFTNDFVEPHAFNETPDNVVSMGVDINTKEIELFIGQKGCLRISVMGPTAFSPAFNDKEFDPEKDPLYGTIINVVSDAMVRTTDRQFKKDKKEKKESAGGISINASDIIQKHILTKIEGIDDDDEREKTQNFVSFVGLLEVKMVDLFKRYSDWFYVMPSGPEDDARYVKVLIDEEIDSTPEEGFNLGNLPDTASMIQFSMDKLYAEITAGSYRVIGVSFKDEIFIMEAINDKVKSHPRYNELHDMFEELVDDWRIENE